jgi:hypothetical protein
MLSDMICALCSCQYILTPHRHSCKSTTLRLCCGSLYFTAGVAGLLAGLSVVPNFGTCEDFLIGSTAPDGTKTSALPLSVGDTCCLGDGWLEACRDGVSDAETEVAVEGATVAWQLRYSSSDASEVM